MSADDMPIDDDLQGIVLLCCCLFSVCFAFALLLLIKWQWHQGKQMDQLKADIQKAIVVAQLDQHQQQQESAQQTADNANLATQTIATSLEKQFTAQLLTVQNELSEKIAKLEQEQKEEKEQINKIDTAFGAKMGELERIQTDNLAQTKKDIDGEKIKSDYAPFAKWSFHLFHLFLLLLFLFFAGHSLFLLFGVDEQKEFDERFAKMEKELRETKQLVGNKMEQKVTAEKVVSAENEQRKDKGNKTFGDQIKQWQNDQQQQQKCWQTQKSDDFEEKFAKMEKELRETKQLVNKMEQQVNAEKVVTVVGHQQQKDNDLFVLAALLCVAFVLLLLFIAFQINALKKQFNAQLMTVQNEKQQKSVQSNELLEKIAKMEQEQKEISKNISTVESFIGILRGEVPHNWWDVDYCYDGLEIDLPKCLAVNYKSNGKVNRSVFAKHPISSDIFYFEVKVKEKISYVFFGLGTKEMPLYRIVGGYKDSFGYSSGGLFWNNSSYKCEENSSFFAGDFVGCGVHLTNRRIFFTKNGQQLATTYDIPSSLPIDSLFPCVSLDSSGDKIEANFGPFFKFDVGTL